MIRPHPHCYYRDELYLFMEYCNQGTLWSVAKQGLPEDMIRKYTKTFWGSWCSSREGNRAQGHQGWEWLHDVSDLSLSFVTGTNIFLSNDSVKLGDFGLSVHLRNINKTGPQQGQRGTIRKATPTVFITDSLLFLISFFAPPMAPPLQPTWLQRWY